MNFVLLIVFILQTALSIVLGTFFKNSVSDYVQIYLTQVLPIFIPALICCLMSADGFRGFARNTKPSVLNIILCIILAVCANIILSFLTTFADNILFPNNSNNLSDINLPQTTFEFVLDIIFICLMPAIFEETLFRGAVLTSYEKIYGSKKAIMLCGFVFALMHNSISHFIPQFIIGVFLSFVVLKFDSLYLGMIAHFTNNFTTLFIQCIILEKWSGSKTVLFRNPFATLIVFILIFAAAMVAALRLNRNISFKQKSLPWKVRKREKKYFKLIVLLFIILQLVFYFFKIT